MSGFWYLTPKLCIAILHVYETFRSIVSYQRIAYKFYTFTFTTQGYLKYKKPDSNRAHRKQPRHLLHPSRNRRRRRRTTRPCCSSGAGARATPIAPRRRRPITLRRPRIRQLAERHQIRLHHAQRRQLLAQPSRAVILSVAPAGPARVLRPRAALRGAQRGRLQHRRDLVDEHGRVDGRLGQRLGEQALVGGLLGVAGVLWLAGGFVEDVCGVVLLRRCVPPDGGGFEEPLRAVLPGALLRRAVGEAVHDGAAVEDGAQVLGPLDVVELRAVLGGIATIPDAVVVGDQPHGLHPCVRFLGPVGVGLVVCELGETRGELEEEAVGEGVLVVVAVVEGEDLPAKTAVAGGIVPA